MILRRKWQPEHDATDDQDAQQIIPELQDWDELAGKPCCTASHFAGNLLSLMLVLAGGCGGMYRFRNLLFPLSFRRISDKSAPEIMLHSGEYDQAVTCYERALELDPENITLKFELADIYFQKNNKMEYEYLLQGDRGGCRRLLPNSWRVLMEN